jgi:hypothetical protein
MMSAGADRGSTGAATSAKSACAHAAGPRPAQRTITNLKHWLIDFKNIKDTSLFIQNAAGASQNSLSPRIRHPSKEPLDFK